MFKKILLVGAAISLLSTSALAQPLNPTPATSVRYSSQNAAIEAVRQAVLAQSLAQATRANQTTKWTYVGASGGILDTTSTTIKAAAGAGKKAYVSTCQFSNSGSGAAGTEIILYTGTSATPIWRGWIGTLMERQATFAQPLETTANALMGVVLSSATNVAVRVNCQGFTD